MKKKVAFLAVFLLALYLVSPVVAAAAVSPGSTSSIAGFPVTQSFTGLTASTSYTIHCSTNGNSSEAVFTSDSAGAATVTLTPPSTEINTYTLRLTAGSNVVLTWNVDNLNIMIYLLPLVTLMILFGVIGAITKAVKF